MKRLNVRFVIIAVSLVVFVSILGWSFNIPGVDNYTIKPTYDAVSISPLTITVFYESLCPDSQNFFSNQLLPLVERFPQSYFDIDLVPYGKATTRGRSDFTCQHGSHECLGNKYHSCTLANTVGLKNKVKVAECLLRQMPVTDWGETLKMCLPTHERLLNSIKNCAEGNDGNNFHYMSGEKTKNSISSLTYVPTILINDSMEDQRSILRNLSKVVCQKLNQKLRKPRECTSM